MFLRRFARLPQHPVALFLALTLLPASALVWLGWRFIEADRANEERQIYERREQATDLVVTALQHAIATDEQQLADPAARWTLAVDDARIVVIGTQRIQTYPETRLLYYPFRRSLPEAPAALFGDGEDDEFRLQNYASAIQKFRSVAQSPNAAAQAGALLRIARNFRKSNDLVAALKVYGELARHDSVAVFGVPADLVGRDARCLVLHELGRLTDLQREAKQLEADLHAGRWQLERATYLLYADDISQWLGKPNESESLGWTAVVEPLWEKWNGSRTETGEDPVSGRELFHSRDESYAVMWRASSMELVALAAGPQYIKKNWLAEIEPVLAKQDLALTLENPDQPRQDQSFTSQRSVTGLPWRLVVENSDPQRVDADFRARRRLLLAGLAFLVIVVSGGSYFIARSVSRELALARLQSDFVAAVSHEFRTPLTTLGQATEVLTDGRITDPSRLHSYYEAQARATGRLQRLVESLLDFGRMEAGSKPYRMQTVDVFCLVSAIAEEFRKDAGASRHTIEVALTGDHMTVNADPDALAHALRNLLDNAVKYSPDAPTIRVEVEETDGRVAIRVRDQGFGIPFEEQREIFRKFVRGTAARSSSIKGTGVGLAMVKHIVQAHRGEIRVESAPGKGSTFTILL